MQFLRTLIAKLPIQATRRYAQVHDITIKADDNRILGSMERNGTYFTCKI
jgi:hypothetical protein